MGGFSGIVFGMQEMKNIILLVCLAVVLSGCATEGSLLKKQEIIWADYESGKITKEEYDLKHTALVSDSQALRSSSANEPNIFQQQFTEVEQAYRDGRLTYSEYRTHRDNIEQRRIQAISAVLGYMGQQQQRYQLPPTTPRTTKTTGTISPDYIGGYCYEETIR